MTAAKSGNHIYVSGTGNTLASVTADIADTTFIEDMGSGVYRVKGNVARYLEIRSGGELIIGDEGDYSVYERLEFENLADGRTYFRVDHGSKFTMVGNTELDFSISSYRPNYARFQGHIDILGDGTNNPLIAHPYRIYMQDWDTNADNGTFDDDRTHLNNVTLASAFNNDYYFFNFDTTTFMQNHRFENILCDRTLSSRNIQRTRYFYANGTHLGMERVVFDNINFNDVGYACLNYGTNMQWVNCTYGTSYSWKLYEYYHRPMGVSMQSRYDETGIYTGENYGQAFSFYDNCTFKDLNSKNVAIIARSAAVLFRDCDWENTSSDSIQVDYQGVGMIWTGNTFADPTPYFDVNQNSFLNWVFGLDLTIQDDAGNPIQDAMIRIVQSEGKEEYHFKTNSSGKIIALYDLEVALLTWKYKYREGDETTNFVLWSDSSNSTYHTAYVMKEGYRSSTTTYVMDADRSDTIILKRLDNYSLTF